ncbi:hypothetical protein FHT40_003577 [Mycolicibacterium sp. BK556]|uniref:hypothetical protein n=1 Tax=Mycobacteriaceae TaxID=1762 RepID=UPI0010604569|nr:MULTISPECIES: hypothetical protein [Mycobacteriaceae]MBB3603916.1 hypothetical protein [Mycolicibacterium sp. BK556]MBB3634111.1 hypothetical protein [Mycolicibacterium sp. BK607]MBB3751692.1 hypothetical protein [Mycolicibacterium sp. BK634]TDO12206.1 hypothetical protein EV580_3932 [Mycobacterium sp. BK086]
MTSRRLGGLTAAALLSAGLSLGTGLAAADPGDYTVLLVDPNVVTDSLAYTAAPPVLNPGGQPGAMTLYTHRDGRTIADTVWVLGDPGAAAGAISSAQAATPVADSKTVSVPVGTNGQLISGKSPDGTRSLSVLYFTEGNAASSLEFTGPAGDPVPQDLVVEFGKQQDALIKSQLGT